MPTATNNTTATPTTAPDALYRSVQSNDQTSNDHNIHEQPKSLLSSTAASLALLKGNIGPGILNLPRAFAMTGYGLGSVLFAVIAAQGIYSMWLLVECQQSNHTFMGLAQSALGKSGGRLVEVLLFVLQGGVCCVFLSLIATNLHAAIDTLSKFHATMLVAVYMMLAATLRHIKDLFYLNMTANTFMLLAITTAVVAGLSSSHPTGAVFAKPSYSNVIFFTSDLFFAFEGIGLVLPIENDYDHTNNRVSFSFVLLQSMAVVALAFGMTGVAGSIGFDNIQSGSITAFLHKEYPNVLWYSIVNVLVIVAVALTFPLQLAPAAQVLEGWVNKNHRNCVDDDALDLSESSMTPMTPAAPTTEDSDNNHNDTKAEADRTAFAPVPEQSPENITGTSAVTTTDYSWLYQRWGMVIVFSMIVLAVDDLSLLMGLFGAVGQTGLAGMPCAIHLSLQYQGRAPRCIWMSIVDILVLMLTFVVMIAGCIASVREILAEH